MSPNDRQEILRLRQMVRDMDQANRFAAAHLDKRLAALIGDYPDVPTLPAAEGFAESASNPLASTKDAQTVALDELDDVA